MAQPIAVRSIRGRQVAGAGSSRKLRGIATRYDKPAVHVAAAVFLAAVVVYRSMSLEPTA
ncbi:MAG: hypothetical protein WBG11_08230 [Methylocella sp.]